MSGQDFGSAGRIRQNLGRLAYANDAALLQLAMGLDMFVLPRSEFSGLLGRTIPRGSDTQSSLPDCLEIIQHVKHSALQNGIQDGVRTNQGYLCKGDVVEFSGFASRKDLETVKTIMAAIGE